MSSCSASRRPCVLFWVHVMINDCCIALCSQGKQGKVAEVLVRKLSSKDLMDIRICVLGNVDAGKSTLVGVLTNGALDDGRVRMFCVTRLNSCGSAGPGTNQHLPPSSR